MKISKIIILTLLIMTIPIPATILLADDATNLLQNPGFELETTGWQVSGGTLTYINNHVYAGNRAGILFATEAEACIYQTVHVFPGSSCTFSGWAFKNSIYEGNVSLQISWFEGEDGTGSEIRRDESDCFADNPNDYRFLTTGTRITPDNAHSAKVKATVRPSNPGQPVTAYFDDMSFVEIIPSYTPPPTCAPNLLLTNPGFEEGLSGWSTYAGTPSIVESPTRSGAYAVAITSNSMTTIWIDQTISIQGGANYIFCGYALKNDPNIEKVSLRISWYESEDGFGTNILAPGDSLVTLTDDQPQYRVLTAGEYTAPLNARSARVKAIVVPHSANPATVYFDDFSFIGPAYTASPTPTVTSSPTPTPITTLTPTSTSTPASTPTPTPTSLLTPSPSLTITPTPIPTPTITTSPVPTSTIIPTPTLLPTASPIATPADEGGIVINEVQYNPPQEGTDTAYEWLELTNRTGRTIDLTDWSISDNHESDIIPSLNLPPGGFAVVAARTDFYANFPNFSGSIVFIADGSIGNGLSNTGDRLILADPTGKIIDSLSYGDDTTIMSPSCSHVPQGHSLERQPSGLDTNQASDFVNNSTPSPGYSQVSDTETPTPTPSLSPSPTATPTPTTSTSPTPTATSAPSITSTPSTTPMLTPSLTPKPTPAPDLTISPSTSQAEPRIRTIILVSLFLIGVTLFAAAFWLKKQS